MPRPRLNQARRARHWKKRCIEKQTAAKECLLCKQPYGLPRDDTSVSFWHLPKKKLTKWTKLPEYECSETLNSDDGLVMATFRFSNGDKLNEFLKAINFLNFPVTKTWGPKGYRAVPNWA